MDRLMRTRIPHARLTVEILKKNLFIRDACLVRRYSVVMKGLAKKIGTPVEDVANDSERISEEENKESRADDEDSVDL